MPRSAGALAGSTTGGAPPTTTKTPHLRLVDRPPLRVLDVAMFYAERSGGIRTYLEAKAAYARRTGAFEHHLVVPGKRTECRGDVWTVRGISADASNGYRVPLGWSGLHEAVRAVAPEVILLHDPYWGGLRPEALRRAAGNATIVAVHHSSVDLGARRWPGGHTVWAPVLRPFFRQTYAGVDAVMSNVDTLSDGRRLASLPVRLGLDPAFQPAPDVERGEHVFFAGRLSREKGVRELLRAASRSREPWPLVFAGSGPEEGWLQTTARRLGIGDRVSFRPYISGREELRRAYAEARCVVTPGQWETFGLVTLEAAASGARVVACETTPSAAHAGHLVHRFVPGDPHDLLRAIETARRTPADPVEAARVAQANTWDAAFAGERHDLEELRLW